MLLRKGLGSMAVSREHCRGCRRTPLAGERIYVLASGRTVCALCRARLPQEKREGAQAHLVHAAERPLAVRSLPV
ncbi:MAG: hypothetical protein WKF31_06810 [Thermoleophilaceae bacterium]